MSARKPRGSRSGGTGRSRGTSKAKTARSPRKPSQAPASEAPRSAPPPVVSSPSAAPLGFGNRVSEMPPPSQVSSAEASALQRMAARQGFQSVMSLKPAPASEAVGKSFKEKDQQRLSALRQETAKRPVAIVRPDYFGTSEHRASAEELARMLAGEQVFPKAAARQTHVLLSVARPDPVPDAVLERKALSVASADPAWREPFQVRLEDMMAHYRPPTELEIREGLTLRYGEVVALAGDYYSTPEELTEELTPRVAEAIRGVTPQDEGTFLLNTHRGWFDYALLANENQDHFSPRNWARYAQHHAEALKLAINRNIDAALVRNAFADHFLTDAFASGHLRVPRVGLVGLPGAMPTRKMHDEENAKGLWVQTAGGFVWRAYGDDYLGANPVHLTLTAYAVGLSLLRIFKAYRLQGEALNELIDALGEAPTLEYTAGQMVDPRTLPRFLGPIAGLPDIREHLPVPLGSREKPDTRNVLANYPPQVGLDGKRRKQAPDFDAYFSFE